MVAGYPGVTNRSVTARELHNEVEVFYPYLIRYYEDRYKVAEAHLNDGGETSIKATVLKQGVQNGLEKYQGILQGMQKNPELLAQKDALDEKAKGWAAQPGHDEYAKGISKLEAIVADRERTQRADFDRVFAFARIGAARERHLLHALGRGAGQERRGSQARLPGPRHGTGTGGAEADVAPVRPRARPRELPARARARRATAGEGPPVAFDAARYAQGREDSAYAVVEQAT